ncbi:MAG: gliding motility-associated C-terminal domain-containing protein, partial [Chitinophagaceae bacterium]
KNDIFRITNAGSGITSFQLQIFNRWGQKVHESSSPFAGWDGRLSGKPLPVDGYAWRCSFVINGKPEIKKGVVQLIR